ncbi:hypothetical protein H5P28_05815 [Ruficoccus amylovorans]|uniref:Uncharacterized protein n=1 Tax=Ruficoccus amylovorans TaxID=1804625 RepID=A0A842HE14_9BACT|nr:hypothetical protein [Ruficoccus amylovorans]MBC2593774.1 hypothetical protein [Ruficoccus amylovorans]
MADVIDYSIGFTVPEIEEILAVQKAELKKTQAAYANDGSSVSKRRLDEIHVIIRACQDALVKLAPETYARPRRTAVQSAVIGHLPK